MKIEELKTLEDFTDYLISLGWHGTGDAQHTEIIPLWEFVKEQLETKRSLEEFRAFWNRCAK